MKYNSQNLETDSTKQSNDKSKPLLDLSNGKTTNEDNNSKEDKEDKDSKDSKDSKNSKQRRKRKEISISATKTVNKHDVKIIVEFN